MTPEQHRILIDLGRHVAERTGAHIIRSMKLAEAVGIDEDECLIYFASALIPLLVSLLEEAYPKMSPSDIAAIIVGQIQKPRDSR